MGRIKIGVSSGPASALESTGDTQPVGSQMGSTKPDGPLALTDDRVDAAPATLAEPSDGSVAAASNAVPPRKSRTPYGQHSFQQLSELHPKTLRMLDRLQGLGVPPGILAALSDDLRPQANEAALRALVAERFEGADATKILAALDVAIEAHRGQTQKRKSEATGLDHIPYANHPIQLAKMAILDVPMSAEGVQAALLHDVVEDTVWTLDRLGETFSPKVLELVADLTKNGDETRAEYLARVDGLGGESKLIKCIDRLHNLLRGFSTEDPMYLGRYIDETTRIYVPKIDHTDALAPVAGKFHEVLDAIVAYRDALG